MPPTTPPPAPTGGRLRRCLDFMLGEFHDFLDAPQAPRVLSGAGTAHSKDAADERPMEAGGRDDAGHAAEGVPGGRPETLIHLISDVLGDGAKFRRALLLLAVIGGFGLLTLMLIIGHVTLDPATLGRAFMTTWSQVAAGVNNAPVKTTLTSGGAILAIWWVKRRAANIVRRRRSLK